jgi:hypothetical protein
MGNREAAMIGISPPYVRSDLLTLLAAVGALAGCGGKSTSARQEHPAGLVQDSILGASRIPGASGILRAMAVSDSADARSKREDSISNSKP